MPIIKSAKKRMRQNEKRRMRNFPVRSKMKTLFKNELALIKAGKLKEAIEYLPQVYSIIDTACKKKIIEKNNASRKKSRLARELNALQAAGGSAKKAEAPAKKEEKKEEKAAEKAE